jgi:hypothetical protein
MKKIEFKKRCNAGVLHSELVKAVFDIFGVSTAGDITIVHLKDTEIKDPTAIVETHVYSEGPSINWKDEYKKAGTIAEKIEVIAQMLGLK